MTDDEVKYELDSLKEDIELIGNGLAKTTEVMITILETLKKQGLLDFEIQRKGMH